MNVLLAFVDSLGLQLANPGRVQVFFLFRSDGLRKQVSSCPISSLTYVDVSLIVIVVQMVLQLLVLDNYFWSVRFPVGLAALEVLSIA